MDKDHDTHRIFSWSRGMDIEAGIVQRKGSRVKEDGNARDDAVRAVRKREKEDTNKRWATQEGTQQRALLPFSKAGLESM